MAYITKRGSSYSVRYTYQDEHGKSCDKWESFPTKEEAVKRQKQIEHELATGNYLKMCIRDRIYTNLNSYIEEDLPFLHTAGVPIAYDSVSYTHLSHAASSDARASMP